MSALALLLALAPQQEPMEGPIEVGARRELFVDRALVQSVSGGAELRLQRPEPREVVLVTDAPWEGNTCAYYTLFEDVDADGAPLFRMYYRGSHHDTETRAAAHREVVCTATSRDGVTWEKPALGLVEFEGSRANNIVWDGVGSHNFTVFRDANPACPADERYKALGSGTHAGKPALFAFVSPDGLRWRALDDEPAITVGAFDSQNLAFWDAELGAYREYHRTFVGGVRAVMTGTSADFRAWSEPALLTYPDGTPDEHLYTNAVLPYARSPHLLLGFPTRYQPTNAQVEPILMASRDGVHFERWSEPIVPITAPAERDGNRSNYLAWGVLALPESPDELSVYATEAYYAGPDSRLRRFVYRVDGFASLSADAPSGELVTVPLRLAPGTLRLNYRARGGGAVHVELLDAKADEVLAASGVLGGDETDAVVVGVRAPADGRAVRLRFRVGHADVFAWRFAE